MKPGTLKVRKSNDLIEASYKLTLNEQRLVLAVLSQVKPFKPIPTELKLTAHEFAERMRMPENQAYEALEDAANRLYERDIQTHDGRNVERFRWCSSIKYQRGEGFVTLRFTPEITPYLANLHGRFTQFALDAVAGLTSPTTIRIYEMLMQWKAAGMKTPEIPLDVLKERLGLEDRYPRFFDFRKRVLDPAADELRRESDLEVTWRVIKQGRSIKALQFSYQIISQMQLDLAEKEQAA